MFRITGFEEQKRTGFPRTCQEICQNTLSVLRANLKSGVGAAISVLGAEGERLERKLLWSGIEPSLKEPSRFLAEKGECRAREV